MARFRGPHGSTLDQLIDAFEQLVVRALKKVARAAANLLRSGGRAAAGGDLGVIRGLWADAVDGLILPALEKIFGTAAKTVAEQVEALTAPDPADFLRAARDRLLHVGDRLWEVAREELAQGVEAGDDIPALAARVVSAAGVTQDLAVVVARTECISANNAASLAQARMLGDPTMIKEWISTPDQRTRPSHRKADGQRVKVGAQFKVGDTKLDFPGDPDGDQSEVRNCRCSLVFDLDDEPLTAAKSAYDEAHGTHRDGEGKFAHTDTGGVDVPESPFGGMHAATDDDRAAFQVQAGQAIPPAWTDVYIADDLDTAKLLVRGKDSKGRGQSIYSAAHTEAQAAVKFQRVKELARHIDKLDHSVERDAGANDSAAALLLIRRLGMRPGSDRDTGAKVQAHGATNLRTSHVAVDGSKVAFDFVGKKGVHIQLAVDDPLIADTIGARLARLGPDAPLFDTDETRTRDYMRSTGVPAGFLLKDLRTLHANVAALRAVAARDGRPATKTEFRKWRKEVAEQVSAELGNTPALALASYISPTVWTSWAESEDWLS